MPTASALLDVALEEVCLVPVEGAVDQHRAVRAEGEQEARLAVVRGDLVRDGGRVRVRVRVGVGVGVRVRVRVRGRIRVRVRVGVSRSPVPPLRQRGDN